MQNAMIPFGVEGGTRSRAAERMITYSTTETPSFSAFLRKIRVLRYLPLLMSPNMKNEKPNFDMSFCSRSRGKSMVRP